MGDYHFFPADVLLPKKHFEKWAVVACDQYTSEPIYWNDVKEFVGDAPSSLNIMLPEIYLGEDDQKNIDKVNKTMVEYTQGEVFGLHENSMIYVERETSDGLRLGIVGLIDLDEYDYHKGSDALIRATEQTVIERIPPRVNIRKDASLEMPHILLLIDDKDKKVIEPLKEKASGFDRAYDFDLMQDGGHISGYFLDDGSIREVQEALNDLIKDKSDKLLFAVGDGNHSLASAKECYNLTKNPLAKYALVEIENIHDPAIQFEPIYRVLFNIDRDDFLDKFKAYCKENGKGETQRFEVVYGDSREFLDVKATSKLPVGTLQTFIDGYIKENPDVRIDYIHGEQVVYDLCKEENTLGFIFEGMGKDDLFPAIKQDGSLPRKTFSMGHAKDKRYYIETRKIR